MAAEHFWTVNAAAAVAADAAAAAAAAAAAMEAPFSSDLECEYPLAVK